MIDFARSSSGSELCEVLDWDSTFFGFPIARVTTPTLTAEHVREIDSWARERGIRCLYFLCDLAHTQTLRLAESSGFQLVDIRVTLERSLPGAGLDVSANQPTNGIVVRAAQPNDSPALEEIARVSYGDSRFYTDGRFPRARCD